MCYDGPINENGVEICEDPECVECAPPKQESEVEQLRKENAFLKEQLEMTRRMGEEAFAMRNQAIKDYEELRLKAKAQINFCVQQVKNMTHAVELTASKWEV